MRKLKLLSPQNSYIGNKGDIWKMKGPPIFFFEMVIFGSKLRKESIQKKVNKSHIICITFLVFEEEKNRVGTISLGKN